MITRWRNEKQVHADAKRQAHDAALAVGARSVLLEHMCCDVYARFDKCHVCIQVECSPKHVIANARRNMDNGGTLFLIVCEPASLIPAVSRKLVRSFPDAILARIAVTSLSDVDFHLKSLVDRYSTGCFGVDSGCFRADSGLIQLLSGLIRPLKKDRNHV